MIHTFKMHLNLWMGWLIIKPFYLKVKYLVLIKQYTEMVKLDVELATLSVHR